MAVGAAAIVGSVRRYRSPAPGAQLAVTSCSLRCNERPTGSSNQPYAFGMRLSAPAMAGSIQPGSTRWLCLPHMALNEGA